MATTASSRKWLPCSARTGYFRAMDVPPSQQPQQGIPKQGVGCCGGGCVALLVIAFLGLAALIGSGWYLVHKAIDTFTSTEPANVAIAMPSDAEFAAANEKLDHLRNALRNREGATFTFTAAELNALVARHPDFAARKGKMRFAIADSIATVEMSVPLNTARVVETEASLVQRQRELRVYLRGRGISLRRAIGWKRMGIAFPADSALWRGHLQPQFQSRL